MSPADGFVSGAPARIMETGATQRRFIRLRTPVALIIEGVAYPVRDWSAGGICLEGVVLPPTSGTVLEALLRLDLGHLAVEVGVEARVLRTNAERGMLAAEFIDLAPATQGLLHAMVNAGLTGDVVSSDMLRRVPSEPSSQARGPALRPPSLTDRLMRGGFLAGTWALALGLFAVIAVGTMDRLFVVRGTGVVTDSTRGGSTITLRVAEKDLYRLRLGNQAVVQTLFDRTRATGLVKGLAPDGTNVLIGATDIALRKGDRVTVKINTLRVPGLP